MDRFDHRLKDVEHRLASLENSVYGKGRPLSANGSSRVPGLRARCEVSGRLYDLEVHARDKLPSVAQHFERLDVNAALKAGMADLERLSDQVARLRTTVAALEGSAGSVQALSGSVEVVNARADANYSSVLTRQCRIEATMASELPAMKEEMSHFKNALKGKMDAWIKEATIMQRTMREKDACLAEEVLRLKDTCAQRWTSVLELQDKLDDSRVDNEAGLATVRDMVRSLTETMETALQEVAAEMQEIRTDVRRILVRGA
eukprot:TRINITY_DN121675_c0_g1_i1.p1 TRINITY_DN121675_c0_g1~~TRINITY_DN121675_c0_g1_i1.p1  ORF type:complete len:260 (-),score=67.98 TRINITY_DN121675_c0_g1_i1:353-1132(-)